MTKIVPHKVIANSPHEYLAEHFVPVVVKNISTKDTADNFPMDSEDILRLAGLKLSHLHSILTLFILNLLSWHSVICESDKKLFTCGLEQ